MRFLFVHVSVLVIVVGFGFAKNAILKGPPTLSSQKSSQKKTANEGKDVKLTCPVSGNPEPIIEWSKGNDAIPDEGWERFRAVKNSLKIKEVVSEDQGTYVCKAVNGFGSVQFTYYLNVLASFGNVLSSLTGDELRMDQVFPVSGSALRKVSGQNVLFKCTAKGEPTPEITWLKDGHVLESSSITTARENDYSFPDPASDRVVHQTLPLSQLTPEDSGNYTCLATNVHGSVTANWTLNVVGTIPNEGPETYPLEMSNVSSFSGEEAALSCRGSWDSGITPKVMWLRQIDEANLHKLPTNQTFPYMGRYFQVLQPTELLLLDNGHFMTKLVFRNVQSQDAGLYFCTVSNRYGINFRQANLTVVESDSSRNIVLMFSGLALGIVIIIVLVSSISICRKKSKPSLPLGPTERALIPHSTGASSSKLQPTPPSHQQRYVIHHQNSVRAQGIDPSIMQYSSNDQNFQKYSNNDPNIMQYSSNDPNIMQYPGNAVHLGVHIPPPGSEGTISQDKPILIYQDSTVAGSIYQTSHHTNSSLQPAKFEFRRFDVI